MSDSHADKGAGPAPAVDLDHLPAEMSPVIAGWIVTTNDHLAEEVRDGREWQELLRLAVSARPEREEERLSLVMDWMRGRLAAMPRENESGRYAGEWAVDAEKVAADATDYAAQGTASRRAAIAGAYTKFAYAPEYEESAVVLLQRLLNIAADPDAGGATDASDASVEDGPAERSAAERRNNVRQLILSRRIHKAISDGVQAKDMTVHELAGAVGVSPLHPLENYAAASHPDCPVWIADSLGGLT